MCSQWACRSLSVILILFNFHLSLMLLFGSWALLWSPRLPPLSIPRLPLPRYALLYESHRNPGQRVSATISPEERCYRDATVSCPLIIPTLARHRGHGRLLKLAFVWHLSPNIYLLWVVWHLKCNITLLWISMLLFVGLIWYLPYGRKWFNLTKSEYCCAQRYDERNN